jgi:bis(5'-nucleosyl)-tetraphosphatase (symmetrical)
LLEWLRRQPILAYPDEHTVLVHAGIPPHWSIEAAATYAKELESQLQGSLEQLDELLPNLYSKKADKWHSGIEGFTRMRAIANYFTRMRLCQQDGLLEFDFNAGLDEPMPTDFLPWFEWQVPRTRKILFGHWAALQGEIDLPHARALDGGCVWGNCLLAYRLSDGKVIASSAQCPSS